MGGGEDGYVHVPNPLRVRRKHERDEGERLQRVGVDRVLSLPFTALTCVRAVPKRKVQLPLSKVRRKSSASRETLLKASQNTYMV